LGPSPLVLDGLESGLNHWGAPGQLLHADVGDCWVRGCSRACCWRSRQEVGPNAHEEIHVEISIDEIERARDVWRIASARFQRDTALVAVGLRSRTRRDIAPRDVPVETKTTVCQVVGVWAVGRELYGSLSEENRNGVDIHLTSNTTSALGCRHVEAWISNEITASSSARSDIRTLFHVGVLHISGPQSSIYLGDSSVRDCAEQKQGHNSFHFRATRINLSSLIRR
jgi:hypothetical protein